MKKKVGTILTFLLLLFTGCGDKTKTNADSGTNIITLTSIEDSLIDTVFFKPPHIVALETIESEAGSSLIGRIRKIATDDDYIFILDQQVMQLLVFDINGKFIKQISKIGQGPEEYVQLINFTLDTVAKQIILLCAIPTKLMYFSYDGKLLKQENNDMVYMGMVKDNEYLYCENVSNILMKEGDFQFTVKNTKNNTEETVLPQVVDIHNNAYNNGHALTKGRSTINYVRRFDNSIYRLRDGKVENIYTIDFKRYWAPESLKNEEEPMNVFNSCHENNYIFSMTNVVNTHHFLIFHTERAIFVYDKYTKVLKGYKNVINKHLHENSYLSYHPLESSDKIAFEVDPAFIRISSNLHDEKLSEISGKLIPDSNPVLFIYDLKD
jgi:hypothetical protein